MAALHGLTIRPARVSDSTSSPSLQPASPPLPSFSVLVANHNHARLVGLAIASVLGQDYPADLREVVVVDDGSTDDSRERLQAYASTPGVRVVLQDNRGQTAAYAAALAHAGGDYICLLDADDSCLPHKLRRLAEHIAGLGAAPDGLFLCHDLQIVDGAGGEPIAGTWFDTVGVRRFGAHLHVASASHFFPFAVTSGMVFGRALLQRAMAEIPQWEWPMGTDGVLGHTAMLLIGEVHYVQEALGRYVVHGGNDFAAIDRGRFVQKPVWHGRWPKTLRFLELLLDSLPLTERERDDRAAYLGRVEHAVRAVPGGRPHAHPLLSFIVDARTPARAQGVATTALAIARQSIDHHETLWLCGADVAVDLPTGSRRVDVAAAAGAHARMAAGVQAARGGYLCFLDAGDLPERRHAERHLQCHRFGALPMLTVSDLRLLDAAGVVVHAGIMATAAGWGGLPSAVPAFGNLLKDWLLAPLPAVVMRRTPLLDTFFQTAEAGVPDRLVGWLLCQYLLQMGGATRLAECLVDLRLPAGATPNPSWLSQFISRDGPVPLSPADLAAAAEALFAAYARSHERDRSFFAESWEARFLRWLLQSGGAEMPARIERRLQHIDDAAWATRVRAVLRAATAR